MTDIIKEATLAFLNRVGSVTPYPDFDTAKKWYIDGYMDATGKYQNMLVRAGIIDNPPLRAHLEKLDKLKEANQG